MTELLKQDHVRSILTGPLNSFLVFLGDISIIKNQLICVFVLAMKRPTKNKGKPTDQSVDLLCN